MFSYQGSKRLELKEIEAYQPTDIHTIVDAFGGGGSVFLHYLKEGKHKKYIYNDILTSVYELVKTIGVGVDACNQLVERARSVLPENEEELKTLMHNFKKEPKGEYYLALSASCMRGNIGIPKIIMRNMITKNEDGSVSKVLKNDHKPLRDISQYCRFFHNKDYEICNVNYKELIERFKNDDGVFIYCDPPYLSRSVSNDQYGEIETNYVEYIAECMRTPDYKCKIMLNIDFTGHTYHLLKDLIKYTYEKRYMARKKVHEKFYHLIATNYEIATHPIIIKPVIKTKISKTGKIPIPPILANRKKLSLPLEK